MAINRAAIKSQVHRGADRIVGLSYRKVPDEWRKIFDVMSSDQAFVEEPLMTGFGAAPTRAEGSSVVFDDAREAWTARYTHEEIALAFRITQQAIEDNQFMQMTTRMSSALGRSFAHTKNSKCAAVLNNGFNSSYTGGDGVEFFSTSHPTVSAGNQSNILSTPADLSETSLEALISQINLAEDDRGINVMIGAKCLIVHSNEIWNANRILNSDLRSGTADNDTNALKDLSALPEGIHSMRYLTDTDAWFIKTDCPDGMKFYRRVGMQSASTGDFDTDDYKYRCRERYSVGWTDWRSCYASAGAA